jgi:curli biogenesis system outer membrane secretion channel CsgG
MKACGWIAAAFLAIPVAAHAQRVTSKGGPDMDSARSEQYDGPKARLVVADFEDKMSTSGQYRGEYGRGMLDMLKTALFQTNRYVLLEREKIAAVEAERARRAARGRPKVELEDADIVVTAAITGFEPESGGTDIGKGIGGKWGSLIGSVAGSMREARVAMDIRLVDVDTGRVIAATSVEGKASSFGMSSVGGSLGSGLSHFSKGPMEAAIRQMIGESVTFIVGRTPATYYRYQ